MAVKRVEHCFNLKEQSAKRLASEIERYKSQGYEPVAELLDAPIGEYSQILIKYR